MPNVSYAKTLFEVERRNYVGYWMRLKKVLDSGKGLVYIIKATQRYPGII